MKIIKLLSVIVCAVVMLSACHSHEFGGPTCVLPKTCIKCGETEGEANGHSLKDADCENPQICVLCNETFGEAKGHSWVNADCLNPKKCSDCNKEEGTALGHTTEFGICNRCNEEQGAELRDEMMKLCDQFIEIHGDVVSAFSAGSKYINNDENRAMKEVKRAEMPISKLVDLSEKIYDKCGDIKEFSKLKKTVKKIIDTGKIKLNDDYSNDISYLSKLITIVETGIDFVDNAIEVYG